MPPHDGFPAYPGSRRLSGRRSGGRGFTLMETLVAMMILAVALTLVLELFSGSLKAGRTSKDYTRAGLHASEQMENLALTPTLRPGVVSGRWDDGYSWEANITAAADGIEAAGLPVSPLKIELIIRWSDGPASKFYQIETLVLGRNPDRPT